MGFDLRLQENTTRAPRFIKHVAEEVGRFRKSPADNPKLDLASNWKDRAFSDAYSSSARLPKRGLYSGIIYQAMGSSDQFTVRFGHSLAR